MKRAFNPNVVDGKAVRNDRNVFALASFEDLIYTLTQGRSRINGLANEIGHIRVQATEVGSRQGQMELKGIEGMLPDGPDGFSRSFA